MRTLLAKIRKILKDRRTRQLLTRTVSVTAAIVVFVTTYALVLPAITMEKVAECGVEEHQHDDSCYTDKLICEIPSFSLNGMIFEYDEEKNKNRSNIKKHGISFEIAARRATSFERGLYYGKY